MSWEKLLIREYLKSIVSLRGLNGFHDFDQILLFSISLCKKKRGVERFHSPSPMSALADQFEQSLGNLVETFRVNVREIN